MTRSTIAHFKLLLGRYKVKRNELPKRSGVEVEDSKFDLAMEEVCGKQQRLMIFNFVARQKKQKQTR